MSNAADNTHSASAVPRPSSTILLLRQQGADVEVLLARRHAGMAFMGGLWVFPGGALNAADSSEAALALIDSSQRDRLAPTGLSQMRTLHGQPLSARECLGLAMAACRETFEETGVLLATHGDGRPCDPEVVARLQPQRPRIVAESGLFVELLREEQLRPALDRLVYWAHWITPSKSPRRFDTRFFIVEAPFAQPVIADDQETVETTWLTPAQSIAAAQQGTLPVAPPTLYSLVELQTALQRHRTLAGLLAGELLRPIVPVLPKIVRGEGRNLLLLPWSPAYASASGEGVPADTQYPEALCAQPAQTQAPI